MNHSQGMQCQQANAASLKKQRKTNHSGRKGDQPYDSNDEVRLNQPTSLIQSEVGSINGRVENIEDLGGLHDW